MKKGTPSYHGSVFAQFENDAMDAGPSLFTQYDATSAEVPQPGWTSTGSSSYAGNSDATYQGYQAKKSKASDVFPGFTFGGPLLPFKSNLRDKVFFFVGFNPELQRVERKIDYSSAANAGTAIDPTLGVQTFSRNTNTYYTTARIDAQATRRVHVFGSWLYQLQRQNGALLPASDSTTGQANAAVGNTPASYAHNIGYVAPNLTVNTGADITLTSHIVSTTRFGYYFENYHDFGYPRGGTEWSFIASSIGAKDTLGNPLPAQLQAPNNATSTAINANFTGFNSNKAIQLDQAFSFYKSGWFGTHNFKAGYQLNRLSNYLLQAYNQPYFQVAAGSGKGGPSNYTTQSPEGDTNCAALPNFATDGCQGQYGYIQLYDAGNGGKAISYNHSIFAQDSWTIGHGITLDLGVRIEKEFLPGEATAGGGAAHPINFGWGDKIAPRLGAAWDVFQNGKAKVFGSYGVFNDIMKLNLAISSFGGQYWNTCAYALNTPNLASINVSLDANNRYCSGFDTSLPGHFSTATPAGLTFLENINYRAFPTTCSTCSLSQEGVAPGLKPYRLHEAVMGADYQVSRSVSIEARYDRRRLDHVIEDASIYNPLVGETFVIVNPGEGTNATFSGFCNFLYPVSSGANGQCQSPTGAVPPDANVKAARSYDGIEIRVTKAPTNHWAGQFSYTYSHFRGNYTGLTSSDQADAGGGRNSPNNSRAFDEPYFQFNAFGGSSSGPLPTDRPNTIKGYAYYQLGFLKKFTTDFGIFQTLYQGSPNSTILDAGAGGGAWLVYPYNRGKWVDIKQDLGTGVITVGNPRVYRTPWYNQTDLNLTQAYKVTESKAVSFSATFANLLNQRTVTSVVEEADTAYSSNYVRPGLQRITGGVPFYAAAETAYNVPALLNGTVFHSNNKNGPLTINSQYGQPNTYQIPRTIRLQASFSF
jgi:TonB dependent receptor